jgi:hypothetical protein
MKLLLENWRKYLAEEQAKYAGILMLIPDRDMIDELRLLSASLPGEAVPLSDEDLHVTLLVPKTLKPYKKALKAIREAGGIPSGPEIKLISEIEERIDDAAGKRSWVVWLENQQDMKDYVNQIMEMVGGPLDPEPNRRFHISIANLTGDPHGSVG